MPRPYGDLRAPIPRVFLVRAFVRSTSSKPRAPRSANGHPFTRAGLSLSRNGCLHVKEILQPPGRVMAGSTPAKAFKWNGLATCKAARAGRMHGKRHDAERHDVRSRKRQDEKVTSLFRCETAQPVAPSHRPLSGTLGNPRDARGVGCSCRYGDMCRSYSPPLRASEVGHTRHTPGLGSFINVLEIELLGSSHR